MFKTRRMSRSESKIDLENLEQEEENRRNAILIESSTDDEDANIDLSLEIVEKAKKREANLLKQQNVSRSDRTRARFDTVFDVPSDGGQSAGDDGEDRSWATAKKGRKRESKRKIDEDLRGTKQSEGFFDGLVIDLSSPPPSDHALGSAQRENAAEMASKKKKKSRSRKKTKDLVVKDDEADNFKLEESVVSVKTVEMDAVETFDNEIKAEEKSMVIKDVDLEAIGLLDNVRNVGDLSEASEPNIPEAAGPSDNSVLRKLLRGPRYFDPVDGNLDCDINSAEERRKRPCFICGKIGHNAKYCMQGQDCYICKKRGHIAKRCPEKHQSNPQASKICLRCGDVGHDMSSCWSTYSPKDLKEIQCYMCKNFGHLCCANIIDNGPQEVSCYNCGQSGHTGAGCAKARQNTNKTAPASPSPSRKFCYKCGEEGHFARGCSSSAKNHRWIGESSEPIQSLPKAHKSFGLRSVPHDFGRLSRKRTPPNEKILSVSSKKTKQRGGWITYDPGDVVSTKGKSNGVMSPSPSSRRWKSASRRLSNSRSPLKKHTAVFGTPNSHVSPKPPWHKFSASRFGNKKKLYD